MKAWTLVMSAALCCSGAWAQSDDLVAREAALAEQLRCVVCQNQTVAESQAPIAKDMRKQIAQQLAQGQSDAQVVAFFEQRYGSFVRYAPPWKSSTWLLWCLPFVAVLGGFALMWRTLHRRIQASSPGLTQQERQRAATWLAQGDDMTKDKEQP